MMAEKSLECNQEIYIYSVEWKKLMNILRRMEED